MKIVTKRTIMVSGYAQPVPRNTIVTPANVEDAKVLISHGLAEEYDPKKHKRAKEQEPKGEKAKGEAAPVSGVTKK